MQLGAKKGYGFDIADNIVNQGNDIAKKLGFNNVVFISCDLLEIDSKYYDKFDFIFFTIGAITWFKDLNEVFNIVSKGLKEGGILLINDYHPFMNMLAMEGEKDYEPNNFWKLSYPYFNPNPWVENNGASYIAGDHKNSNTFISFLHTLTDIVSSILSSAMTLLEFNEYDYDIGLTNGEFDEFKYPLSYILIAKKN